MRTRRIAKAGLVELVLWDVILVVLVGGLVFVDGQLQARASVRELPAAGSGEPGPGPRPPEDRPPVPQSDGGSPAVPNIDPREKVEAKADAELKRLREAADQQIKAGDVLAALAAYEAAPPWLKTSDAWGRAWPQERARLGALQRDADTYLCLAIEVQLAADQGRVKRVERLLGGVPSGYRPRLDAELSWARAHVPPAGEGGGLEIRGFSPDQVKLDGRRCVIDCALGREQASALLQELDALAGEARSYFGDPGKRVRVKVLGAAEPAIKAGSDQVVLYQRSDETAQQLAPRARLAVARWLLDQARGKQALTHLHLAISDALAGASGGGGRPALSASGAARRRLFLSAPPDGSGATLVSLAKGAAEKDPARSARWALAHYATFSSDPGAVDLKIELKKAIRGGSLSSALSPVKAAGLEPAWVAWMERQ